MPYSYFGLLVTLFRRLRLAGLSGPWAYATVAVLLLLPMTAHTAKLPARYFVHVSNRYREGYSPMWKEREPMELTGIPVYWYRPTVYSPERIDDWRELERASSTREVVFFHPADDLPPEAGAAQGRCVPRVRTVPEVLFRLGLADLIAADLHWTLFECGPSVEASDSAE